MTYTQQTVVPRPIVTGSKLQTAQDHLSALGDLAGLASPNSASLTRLRERFDENPSTTNFMALYRKIERTLRSPSFRRNSNPDAIFQAEQEFQSLQLALGTSASSTRMGGSAALRRAYENLDALDRGIIPGAQVASNGGLPTISGLDDTLKRLNLSNDVLKATLSITGEEGRRALSQGLVAVLLSQTLPEDKLTNIRRTDDGERLPVGEVRAWNVDGVSPKFFNDIRAVLSDNVIGMSGGSPWLYAAGSNRINQEMMTAIDKLVQDRIQSGGLSEEDSRDLRNTLHLLRALNPEEQSVADLRTPTNRTAYGDLSLRHASDLTQAGIPDSLLRDAASGRGPTETAGVAKWIIHLTAINIFGPAGLEGKIKDEAGQAIPVDQLRDFNKLTPSVLNQIANLIISWRDPNAQAGGEQNYLNADGTINPQLAAAIERIGSSYTSQMQARNIDPRTVPNIRFLAAALNFMELGRGGNATPTGTQFDPSFQLA